MTAITYTAQRELAAGHSASTDYNIGLGCTAVDPDKAENKSETRSLSGRKSQTVVLHRLKRWRVTTKLYGTHNGVDVVREFLESVSEGETFSFDEFGSVGAPDAPIDVALDGKYEELRVIKHGNGGREDEFRFSFTIRER